MAGQIQAGISGVLRDVPVIKYSNKRGDVGMLILTRRVGETLMIGDDVAVTVLGVKGNQVRIGVKAPRDVSVHREEIYDRIRGDEGVDGEEVEEQQD